MRRLAVCLGTVASVVLLFGITEAQAQVPDVGPSGCVESPLGCGGDGSGGGGNTGGGSGGSGPTFGDLFDALGKLFGFGDDDDGPIEASEDAIRGQQAAQLRRQAWDARNSGDLETAARLFTEAARLRYGRDGIINENLADTLNELGMRVSYTGNYAQAIALFEAGLEAMSGNPDFTYNPGSLYARTYDAIRENMRRARNSLAQIQAEQARQAELERQRRAEELARAAGRIDDVLGGISDSLGADGGNAVPVGSDFDSDPDTNLSDAVAGADQPSSGLGTRTPATGSNASVFVDSNVVDLRDLDGDRPITVDPSVLRAPSTTPALASMSRQAQTQWVQQSGNALRVPAPASKNRTTVLLDALEVGRTDWEESFEWLTTARERYPDDLDVRDAHRYFAGLTSGMGQCPRCDAACLRQVIQESFDDAVLGRTPQEQYDYETWSLLERGFALTAKADPSSEDFEVALRLYRQAYERNPEELNLRDILNFTEGEYHAIAEQ